MRLPFKGSYILTQEFGVNPDNYKQFLVLYPDNIRRPMKGHNGLDFATPVRTEIVAPHGGIIKEALFDKDGYGWYVKIENDEEGSVIAHLDTVDVKNGYQLQEGDHIGWSGSTGNSTGPHTHWGYYRFPRDRSNGIAGFINQAPILSRAGIHVALGKQAVIEGQVAAVPAVEAVENPEGANMYHGLDLNNPESMKTAVDMWNAVMIEKRFISVEEHEEAIRVLRESEPAQVEPREYTEMKALGYTTKDDIAKALEKQNTLNVDLQTENTRLLKRIDVLAGEIQKSAEEDHATAELGQSHIDENTELKHALAEVGKAAGVDKFTTQKIVSNIFQFRDLADRFISKMNAERAAKNPPKVIAPVKADNIEPVKRDNISWLMNIFSVLIPSEKEVK